VASQPTVQRTIFVINSNWFSPVSYGKAETWAVVVVLDEAGRRLAGPPLLSVQIFGDIWANGIREGR